MPGLRYSCAVQAGSSYHQPPFLDLETDEGEGGCRHEAGARLRNLPAREKNVWNRLSVARATAKIGPHGALIERGQAE
jgi:hypothetical protein